MKPSNTINWSPPESKVIPQDELTALLSSCEKAAEGDIACGRRSAIVRWITTCLACEAALRVSEIASLRIEDIRLSGSRPCITVTRGKGGKSRVVPLVGPLSELRNRLKTFIEWKDRVGENGDGSLPLLASKRFGEYCHYSPDSLKLQFKKALEISGLNPRRYSIHCGRHTAATNLYAFSRNLRLVQDILGHSSPGVTAGYAAIVDKWTALERIGG